MNIHTQISNPWRTRRSVAVALLVGLASIGGTGGAWAQSDNFNDNNDNGWVRVNPLGDIGGLYGMPELGLLSSWRVTNGTYVIRCDGPPVADFGPARAGSTWTNASCVYSNFYVAADFVDWSQATNSAIGLLARVQEPINQGSTAGYSLTYEPKVKDFQISALDFGGGLVQTAVTNIDLPSTNAYRFVFIGRGDQLEGRVYLLPDLAQPIATITDTITASELTWQTGYSGLLIFNSQGAWYDSVQATFDNYTALVEEPPPLTIQKAGTQVQLGWPSWANAFQLQRTLNLSPTSWSPVTAGIVSNANGFSYSTPATNTSYFRLILN